MSLRNVSFAGEGPKPMPPGWVQWLFAYGFYVTAVLMVSLLLGLVVGVRSALGACTTIPVTPQETRRDAVCTQLGEPSGCFFSPESLVAAVLVTTETEFSLHIRDQYVGTFPIPNAQPANPSLCDKQKYVESLLRFHTGTPEIQASIRQAFPQVGGTEVVFFDELMGSDRGDGVCVISAQLMVVSP
jgi:hypothetical protein